MPQKQLIIEKNDAGQRLDKFLTKAFPNLPPSVLYKCIRTKDVKLNGKRTEASARLAEGDELSLYWQEEFFQRDPGEYDFLHAPKDINIVYEDENLLLVDKKPGLIVHPDENYHFDSLIARIQHLLYDRGEFDPKEENSFAPALVNRIDRNTGGIVIAAKNAEALRILNLKLRTREIEKKYLCIISGHLPKKVGELTGYLEKNEAQNRVYIKNRPVPGGKTVRTKYRVLDERGDCSLLEVELLTGRTHQIRAHFAHIGHPLLGDGKYGNNSLNRAVNFPYQALYSYKLKFVFSTDAGLLNYLNGKEFTVKEVWFLKEFEKMSR